MCELFLGLTCPRVVDTEVPPESFGQDWVSGAPCSNSSSSTKLLCDFRQATGPLWAFAYWNQGVIWGFAVLATSKARGSSLFLPQPDS